jgi:hypothetical protein
MMGVLDMAQIILCYICVIMILTTIRTITLTLPIHNPCFLVPLTRPSSSVARSLLHLPKTPPRRYWQQPRYQTSSVSFPTEASLGFLP